MNHQVGIPKAQLQTAGIFFGDDTFLKTLTGKGDCHAGGYGIDTVAVANFISLGNRFQIYDVEVGAQSGNGFVLGTPIARIDAIFRIIQSNTSLALNRAGVATFSFLKQQRVVCITADRRGVVQGAAPEVIYR